MAARNEFYIIREKTDRRKGAGEVRAKEGGEGIVLRARRAPPRSAIICGGEKCLC